MSKKALLVIDMVNAYVYGHSPLIPIPERAKLITKLRSVINLAHKNGVPVIYVNSAFRRSDPILKVIGQRDQAISGAQGSRVISELVPQEGDYQLEKRGYDGFWKSGLETLLKKLQISEVLLTGCQTDCCIRETGVTAAHLGFKVFVIEDCCGTSRELGQETAIKFMRSCVGKILQSSGLGL